MRSVVGLCVVAALALGAAAQDERPIEVSEAF